MIHRPPKNQQTPLQAHASPQRRACSSDPAEQVTTQRHQQHVLFNATSYLRHHRYHLLESSQTSPMVMIQAGVGATRWGMEKLENWHPSIKAPASMADTGGRLRKQVAMKKQWKRWTLMASLIEEAATYQQFD